jgi:predicted RNA-binding protein associated with RNAse of E/G family
VVRSRERRARAARRPFAIHLFWHDDGRFSGWYVNLQEPMRLRADGFDTLDHALDVWIEPGAEPELKDDDHLRQCEQLGITSARDAATIRAAAADVCRRRSQLFPTGYETFRPDPHWPVPAMEPGAAPTPSSPR